jgi:hypothetical protein
MISSRQCRYRTAASQEVLSLRKIAVLWLSAVIQDVEPVASIVEDGADDNERLITHSFGSHSLHIRQELQWIYGSKVFGSTRIAW